MWIEIIGWMNILILLGVVFGLLVIIGMMLADQE